MATRRPFLGWAGSKDRLLSVASVCAVLAGIELIPSAAISSGPPGVADFGDAPDGIPSCQFSPVCADTSLYPTVLGTPNAPPGRDAPYHVIPDPLSSVWFDKATTFEAEAFQACCDWISGGCDMDNGPLVLCLGPGCTSGVVVSPGGPCDEMALGTFGPFPGSPTTGVWVFDVSTGPFAGGPGSYFVNVAVDADLSGVFGDAAGEWPLVDAAVPVGPWQSTLMVTAPFPVLTTVPPTPTNPNWNILPFWTRFEVSEQMVGPDFPTTLWDGSGPLGGFLVGETEDWVPLGDPGETGCWIAAGEDFFTTPGGGTTYQDFSATEIPANFFGPGSDPFTGKVYFQGTPLSTTPPGVFGPTDTIVRRLGGTFVPPPGQGDGTVPIEIVALSLVSVQPITVTYSGGTNPEPWILNVTLSSMQPQQPGLMKLVADPCGWAQGGTFSSDLPILPRLVFTRLSDGRTQELDFGASGLPPIRFAVDGGHWLMFEPGDLGLIRGQAGVQVEHDGDERTPPVPLQFGSSNFYAGLRAYQCDRDVCEGSVRFAKRLIPERADFAALGVLPAQSCGHGVQPCPDQDGDGFPDDADNCPGDYNPLQEDLDDDGLGDICDSQRDAYNPCQDPASVEEETHPQSRASIALGGPNPTQGILEYELTLSEAGHATVRVFNVHGRQIRTVLDQPLPAGSQRFQWDPRSEDGVRLGSGIYYLHLDVDGRTEARRFTVIK